MDDLLARGDRGEYDDPDEVADYVEWSDDTEEAWRPGPMDRLRLGASYLKLLRERGGAPDEADVRQAGILFGDDDAEEVTSILSVIWDRDN